MALPAPFMRAIVRPASGWREIKPLVSLRGSGACRPRQARRPVDRPRAEPRHRVAQARRRRSARRRRAPRLPPPSEGTGAGAALLLERRQRALPEGDLVDASPAEMRVHPGHDHRGAVLRLERESAFDPQHQGRGNGRRVGIAFGGPRRPLQLDRPGVTRERFADDRRPIGDQARFAQAPRGQRLGDQPGGEFSQRAWRRRARASSSLRRGT